MNHCGGLDSERRAGQSALPHLPQRPRFPHEQPPPPKVDPRKAALFNQVLGNVTGLPAEAETASEAAPVEVAEEPAPVEVKADTKSKAAVKAKTVAKTAKKRRPDDAFRYRRRRLHRLRVHPPGRAAITAIINFDKLTYAGNLDNLASVAGNPELLAGGRRCLRCATPLRTRCRKTATRVVHFAAESHVDRSILSAEEFVRTNVLGTQVMLDVARHRKVKRFLHISTDEVGGDMPPGRLVSRRRSAASEQSLCGEQDGRGAFRARRGPYLRHGYADHAHQQQLRPLPVSRKAAAAGHFECARRPADSGLRRWTAGARLGPCDRQLPRAAGGARTRTRRRNVSHRRRTSACRISMC